MSCLQTRLRNIAGSSGTRGRSPAEGSVCLDTGPGLKRPGPELLYGDDGVNSEGFCGAGVYIPGITAYFYAFHRTRNGG